MYIIRQILVSFQVSTDWRDIALTLREKVFTKDDAEKIDIHDIKVRKQATSCKCQYKFSSAVIGVNNFSLFVSEHVREYYYNLWLSLVLSECGLKHVNMYYLRTPAMWRYNDYVLCRYNIGWGTFVVSGINLYLQNWTQFKAVKWYYFWKLFCFVLLLISSANNGASS